MNVLSELLHIKEFREDKAERALARASHVLRQASEALDRARAASADYHRVAERRERALYADLCTRLVRLSDLDDVALEVDRMRQEKARHEEQVAQAADAREAAAEQVDTARSQHQEAVRMHEKFSELSRLRDADRDIERQRLEDAEMEEVRPRPPAGADEPRDAAGAAADDLAHGDIREAA